MRSKTISILIVIEDLRAGGAQVFALRLAQSMHEHGHQVHLYSHYPTYINQALVRQIAPDVPVIAFNARLPGLDWTTRKVQGVLRRVGRVFRWREQLVERHLRQTIERLRVQVVNSHMIKSDYVATQAAAQAKPAVPVVITMHGCYEDFLHKTTELEVIRRGKKALQQVAGLVYLAEKNLEVFSVAGVRPLADIPHKQIYNGFDGHFSRADQLPSRAQLGIGEHDFVFGMVARGIPEKGWQYALNSFLELSSTFPQAHLILVGSSEYLSELQVATHNLRVHFVGFANNPIDWARLFDVGLLPSYFASESLPNCIAEYLFCGLPVVSTRIGEVPQMLDVPGQGIAGVLVEQNGRGLTEPAVFTAALRAYLTDPLLLAAHRALAQQCFEKFRMERCVAAYEDLFDAVL